MFINKSAQEFERSLLARMIARSGLTDVTEGSILRGIVGAVSQELAGVELRLAQIRDAFFLEGATGSDLDERVSELPLFEGGRRSSSAASGSVLTLTRASTATLYTLPAGAVFGRVDSSTRYQTTGAATFPIGVGSVSSVPCVALETGSDTNCGAGKITRIVSAPSEILSVINSAPLTSGTDQETDQALRERAYQHLASLAQCQPAALEAFALSFRGTNQERVTFARIFEDPETPGISDLIVDDGTGLEGLSRPGLVVSGVAGAGQTQIWFESPAVSLPTVKINGSPLASSAFFGAPEKGIIHLRSPLLAADTWEVSGYQVRTGILRDLQAQIETRRAAGTRVVVTPPEAQTVFLKIGLVPATGFDPNQVLTDVRDTALSYLAGLGPGEPLLMARLIGALVENAQVLNVYLREPGTDNPAQDVYPGSARRVLRGTSSTITVTLEVAP